MIEGNSSVDPRLPRLTNAPYAVVDETTILPSASVKRSRLVRNCYLLAMDRRSIARLEPVHLLLADLSVPSIGSGAETIAQCITLLIFFGIGEKSITQERWEKTTGLISEQRRKYDG